MSRFEDLPLLPGEKPISPDLYDTAGNPVPGASWLDRRIEQPVPGQRWLEMFDRHQQAIEQESESKVRLEPEILSWEQLQQRYAELGYKSELASDEPLKVYEPHSHHPVYLYGLNGSVRVRIGEVPWHEIKPGDEVFIPDGVEHEAVVGTDGWEYVFAYPEDQEPFTYEPPA